MTLVSVIIPYFNKRQYIEETIQSVLKQSYENLEIILKIPLRFHLFYQKFLKQ